ncbi:AAA family ATPase [Hamadaea tsunoensis]|uniref:AAA family ATPase n=1 Tax=Hamadaea tsunoensis TaxID=53368 RepID=UPI000412B819|nr:AAA family ATPase [Hamadaea tsunoensis]
MTAPAPVTPPAAGVERLPGLPAAGTEPLLVLFGPGLDDTFAGRDYVLRDIQQVTLELLRAAGFECVVFTAAREPIYFRDDASRAAFYPAGEPEPVPADRMLGGFAGPFGDLILATAPDGAPSPVAAPAEPDAGLSDPHWIMMIDHAMRQSRTRTAVVVTHAEEQLTYLESNRDLAGVFAEWLEPGRVSGQNVCILMFRQERLADVRDFVAGQRRLPRLERFLRDAERRRGVPLALRIGAPDAGEVRRLLDVVRLREGLRIGDWRDVEPTVRSLAGADDMRLRDWHHCLRVLAREGVPLSTGELMRRGWLTAALPGGPGAWARLSAMPGLEPIKEHIAGLRAMVLARRQLAARDGAAVDGGTLGTASSLHMVFQGNPGTGKTTVAQLIGEIYRELGLLRKGHLVATTAKDLVAGFLGQTSQRTGEVIDRALGGVLFIDEAYDLLEQGSFGNQATDELVERMERDRGDLVVVVAGYREQMAAFLASNQGLAGRFGAVVDFPDFSGPQLLSIAVDVLAGRRLTWDAAFEARLGEVMQGMYVAQAPGFSNARTARKAADDIEIAWALRIGGDVTLPVTAADIPAAFDAYASAPVPSPRELLARFDSFVGLAAVRRVFTELVGRLQLKQRQQAAGVVAPHLLFLGPPGTGKTTVARLCGETFRALGLLRRGHVVEVSRAELVAGHVGGSTERTKAAVERALDGVLFIDEAYTLSQGAGWDFGQEVIGVLNSEMERLRGRLVVIAAGYPDLMAEFVARNPGLRSRFTERVEFSAYTVAELVEILRRMAAAAGCTVTDAAAARATACLARAQAAHRDDFGNARAVRRLLERMEARMSARLDDGDDPFTFTAEDVPDDLY